MTRTRHTIAAAAALALTLTGCAPTPPDGEATITSRDHHGDTWQLHVCPTTGHTCHWVHVPRGVYEAAHEDMHVTITNGTIRLPESARP